MLLSRIAEELHAGLPEREAEITDVAYDSRKVVPGALFCCLRGEKTDGHRFAQQAVDKGAAALIVEEKLPIDVPQLLVTDGREAMARSAACFFDHPERKMTMLAVTGTNGKTSTTYMVKAVAEEAGLKVGLIGTIHNLIGDEVVETERTTPESVDLFRLLAHMVDRGVDLVIMEVSSHALAQNRAAGIRFKAALFTNLTQDHLDFHGTMEEYAAAKAMLFPMCEKTAGNIDDPWFDTVMHGAPRPVYTFSAKSDRADLTARNIRLTPDQVSFCALEGSELVRTSLHMPGEFSVYNALAALACARMAGVPLKDAAAALPLCRGARGRVESVPTDGDYSVYIDYAVTPDAVENILRTLRGVAPGRLVMLFGCGGDRDKSKRPVMGRIASELSDYVIVTSDNPRTEDPEAIIADILPGLEQGSTPYTVICDRIEAIRWAIENHREGDLILLCGKGHEDYQIIGHEKIHMDEREIVADILRERKERNDR